MKPFYFISFLFLIINLQAQPYKPLDTISNKSIDEFINSYKLRHEKRLSNVKNEFSGEVKRKIESIYVNQYDEFVKGIKKGELYFDKEINNYLQDILNHIIETNPELKSYNFRIYFSRETSVNAFSVGEGTLVIHLELLNTLKSESELAGVICHEVAHYTLNHSEKSIKEYAEKITSDEVKKEERKITKTKYNKQESAEKFIKFVVYSRKSKSREQEFEADSKGFTYFKKTKYNPYDFVNVLSRLGESDKEKDSLSEENYKKIFNTKNQKFLNDWLFMEDYSKYKYSKKHIMNWDIDSLKTHPNCDLRIQKIKELNPTNTNSSFSVDSKMFEKITQLAKMELIFNHFYFKEYGLSLYETLKQLKNEPEDPYLLKMLALNMDKLNRAKKMMKLNNFIPSINPKTQSQSQQRFYNFINNISTNEFDRLSSDFNNLYNK